jgi:hypothetical protein
MRRQYLLSNPGVAYKFGKESDEYEKAGGVRKSERKRPVRKASANPGQRG